jgi:hypothetical protein
VFDPELLVVRMGGEPKLARFDDQRKMLRPRRDFEKVERPMKARTAG